MQVYDYCQQDVQSLAALIKSKQVSAEEVLNCAAQRMQEVNPALNAIVTECVDWGRTRLTAMRGDEPFYGVPILVKDLGFMMEGVLQTGGSKFFSGNIAQQNSDFISRILALGMVPFARTNTPELGLSYVTESLLFGVCRNPYDLNRTTGGSSGGSAAGVAAGIAPIATASDGGGSIRIPAACCGLFGFKPTTGTMPVGPLVNELWSGLAESYVLTRSISDAALLYDKLSIQVPKHNVESKQPALIIARLDGAFAPVAVDKAAQSAVNKVTDLLQKQGHQFVERNLVLDLAAIGECVITLIAANTWAEIENQQMLTGQSAKPHQLEPVTWEFLILGKTISAAQLINAKNRLYQLVKPLHELLEQVDMIITPALAQLPLTVGSLSTAMDFNSYLQKNIAFSPFTSLFNQAGLPAMTIPVDRHQHLPMSVQFAAGKNKDKQLLQFALYLQQFLPDFSKPIMSFV